MKAYIFDIDGTLADLTAHPPALHSRRQEGLGVLQALLLCRQAHHSHGGSWHARCIGQRVQVSHTSNTMIHGWAIVLMSGRNECQRAATHEWLQQVACLPCSSLFMRADGDFRDDGIVKQELLPAGKDNGLRSDHGVSMMAPAWSTCGEPMVCRVLR